MCAGAEVIAKLTDTLSCVQRCMSFSKESHSSVKGLGSAIKCLQKWGGTGDGDGQGDAETAECFLLSVFTQV